MKRSYPYPGHNPANQGQPPPPAGPAPPLPAAPPAATAQSQAYANYGYGQVSQPRSGASAASASPAAASDTQQAQWHQQWQQYYAQQAAAAAVATPPPQPSGQNRGQVIPQSSPQPAHVQQYTPYSQQPPGPPAAQQPGYYPYPQQPTQPAATMNQPMAYAAYQHQAPQPQLAQQPQTYGPQQPGYYPTGQNIPQPTPPSKRPRYNSSNNAGSNNPNNSNGSRQQQNVQSQQPYYPSSHPVGPAATPNLGPASNAPAAAAGASHSYGWQNHSNVAPVNAANVGGAHSMGPTMGGGGGGGGAGRGGAHSRGRGGFSTPHGMRGAQGHPASLMSQASSSGPSKFRGSGRSSGFAPAPHNGGYSSRSSGESSGWGNRSGRSGGGGNSGGSSSYTGSSHHSAGRSNHIGGSGSHGFQMGGGSRRVGMDRSGYADKGSRSGSMGSGRLSNTHGPKPGFSSQNTIPIKVPNGSTGSRDRGSNKTGTHVGSSSVASSSIHSAKAASFNGGHEPVKAPAMSNRGATHSGPDSVVSANSKRAYTDFRIRGIEIEAIGWSWHVSDSLSDDEEEQEKEEEQQVQQGLDDEKVDPVTDDVEDDTETASVGKQSTGKSANDEATDLVTEDDDGVSSSSRNGQDVQVQGLTDSSVAAANHVTNDSECQKSEEGMSGSVSHSKASTPVQAVEPPKGPKAESKKNSSEAKTARARARIAAAVRESTKLRISFAATPNAVPEGTPTGPKAEKARGTDSAKPTADKVARGETKKDKSPVVKADSEEEDSLEVKEKQEPAGLMTDQVQEKVADAIKQEPLESVSPDVVAQSSVDVDVDVEGEDSIAMSHQASDAADVQKTETLLLNSDVNTAAAQVKAEPSQLAQEASQSAPPKSVAVDSPAAVTGSTAESKEAEWSPFSKGSPPISSNRVTIWYAGTRRRLVIDVDAIKSLKLFRAEGRIELTVNVVTASLANGTNPNGHTTAKKKGEKEKERRGQEWVVCKSLLLETRERDQENYVAMSRKQIEEVWKEEKGLSVNKEQGAGVDRSISIKQEADEEDVSSSAPTEEAKAAEAIQNEEEEDKDADADVDADADAEIKDATTTSTRQPLKLEQPKDENETEAKAIVSTATSLGPYNELPPLYRLLPNHDGPASEQNHAASAVSELRIIVYLDQVSSLVEPKWIKKGDVDEWLSSFQGYGQRTQDHVWYGKLEVVDPDPPPSIDSFLQDWLAKSFLGSLKERRSFLKENFSPPLDDKDQEAYQRRARSLIEIVTRLTKGERASFNLSTNTSNNNPQGPLVAAAKKSRFTNTSTHVGLTLLAMLELNFNLAQQAGVSIRNVREMIGSILLDFPPQLLFKGMDILWKETMEKSRTAAMTSSAQQVVGQKRKRDSKRSGHNTISATSSKSKQRRNSSCVVESKTEETV